MNFVKDKKGFSIAEVIISLAIILIVSLSALTIVKASNISSLKTVSCAEARSYTETVLELYKFADTKTEFDERFNELSFKDKFVVDGNRFAYSDNFVELVITVDFDANVFTAVGKRLPDKVFINVEYEKAI